MSKKHWIQGAVKHPGALRKEAAKAGESTHAFAESHKHASGKEGDRARLALSLMSMHHKGKPSSEKHNRALTDLHHQANSE